MVRPPIPWCLHLLCTIDCHCWNQSFRPHEILCGRLFLGNDPLSLHDLQMVQSFIRSPRGRALDWRLLVPTTSLPTKPGTHTISRVHLHFCQDRSRQEEAKSLDHLGHLNHTSIRREPSRDRSSRTPWTRRPNLSLQGCPVSRLAPSQD